MAGAAASTRGPGHPGTGTYTHPGARPGLGEHRAGGGSHQVPRAGAAGGTTARVCLRSENELVLWIGCVPCQQDRSLGQTGRVPCTNQAPGRCRSELAPRLRRTESSRPPPARGSLRKRPPLPPPAARMTLQRLSSVTQRCCGSLPGTPPAHTHPPCHSTADKAAPGRLRRARQGRAQHSWGPSSPASPIRLCLCCLGAVAPNPQRQRRTGHAGVWLLLP